MHKESEKEAATMNQPHFVLVSFPIQGHINPILQLAKNLARSGAQATFVTSVRALHRMNDRLPTINGLFYASFSDGHDQEDVRDFVEYMADLRALGSENLTKLVRKFQDEGRPITCLVYSLLIPWVAEVARVVNMPSAFLAIQSATAFAIYNRFFNSCDGLVDSGISTPSINIHGLPSFSSIDLPTFLLPDDMMNSLMIPMMRQHWQELEKDHPHSFVFLNTFRELEKEAIKELENKFNVVPLGPLLPSAFCNGLNSLDKSFGGDLVAESEGVSQWLDTKAERSVIYVSFGSLVSMSQEQKVEIFHAITESKRPFLWVLRSSDNEDKDTKKMRENTGEGLIVKWCSQFQVLSHKSVGCFVTHCGWNSTLESLACGVPVIGFPHFSDQATNAKLLDEVWRTGVRLRANGGVVVGRNELRGCLETVMGDCDRGKEIRNNAWKWRGLAIETVKEGGSTYNNMKNVLVKLGLKFLN